MRRIVFLLTLAILLFAGSAGAFEPPPNPNGNLLVDQAQVIPDGDESEIRSLLEEYKTSSGNEVAVLVIASLDGVSVADAAYQTFNAWGVGDAKEDNGVLLLIATGDRELRIEVGEGVEGELTDLQSKQIIDNNIVPHLKTEEYSLAVRGGVTGITGTLEHHPDAIQNQAEEWSLVDSIPWWGWIILFIIFIFLMWITEGEILFIFLHILSAGGGGSRSGGGSFGGGSSGGGGASGRW